MGGDSVANYVLNSCELIDNKTAFYKLLSRACLAVGNDIFVPAAAISIFMIATTWNLGCNHKINNLARTTFGIYLIHDSAGLRTFIWDNLFKVSTVQYFSKYYILYSILTIVCVFAICSLIDIIRITLIEPRYLQIANDIINKFKSKYVVKC